MHHILIYVWITHDILAYMLRDDFPTFSAKCWAVVEPNAPEEDLKVSNVQCEIYNTDIMYCIETIF